jgi:hypothetical protein
MRFFLLRQLAACPEINGFDPQLTTRSSRFSLTYTSNMMIPFREHWPFTSFAPRLGALDVPT